MSLSWDNVLRTQLVTRRDRLHNAISHNGDSSRLASLLSEVDSALERLDTATFGVCAGCGEAIEEDRLLSDPLVRTCLGCLSPEEQEALERDLELASRIQGGFLPKHRFFSGWEVGLHYQPAGPVSGDYCDLVDDQDHDGGLLFFLGDISGKGVAASLLMAHLHAIFRSLASSWLPVGKLVDQANRIFAETTISTHYATLICGRARPSGEVEIANAGHCPPVILRNGDVLRVGATGLPIGLFGHAKYQVETFYLRPGDSLFLYTDGVTEAQDANGEQYGLDRLEGFLARHRHLAPQQLVEACHLEVDAFHGGARNRDDVTAMALRQSAA